MMLIFKTSSHPFLFLTFASIYKSMYLFTCLLSICCLLQDEPYVLTTCNFRILRKMKVFQQKKSLPKGDILEIRQGLVIMSEPGAC